MQAPLAVRPGARSPWCGASRAPHGAVHRALPTVRRISRSPRCCASRAPHGAAQRALPMVPGIASPHLHVPSRSLPARAPRLQGVSLGWHPLRPRLGGGGGGHPTSRSPPPPALSLRPAPPAGGPGAARLHAGAREAREPPAEARDPLPVWGTGVGDGGRSVRAPPTRRLRRVRGPWQRGTLRGRAPCEYQAWVTASANLPSPRGRTQYPSALPEPWPPSTLWKSRGENREAATGACGWSPGVPWPTGSV